MDNFIEVWHKDDANKVDFNKYTFIKLSELRGYCFKKRKGEN